MTKTVSEEPTAPAERDPAWPGKSRKRRHTRLAFGLRGRLLVLVFLTLLPAFVIVLYTGHRERQDALASIKQHALALSLSASQAQVQLVSDTRTMLSVLAQIPQVSQATATCPGFLRRYLQTQPRLANIGVLDTTGHLVCNAAHPGRVGFDAADRDYFRRVYARHKFALGDYEIGRITGEPVLVAAYPVLDATTGRLRSILFAALRLKWLKTVAAKANLPTGSVFMLLDHRGQILVRYPGSDARLGRLPTRFDRLTRTDSQGAARWRRMRFDGRDWLVTYAPLRNRTMASGLHVLVSIPAAHALARANQSMYRNLAVLSGLGLLSLLLAWLSGSLLVLRPVRRLVRAVESVTAGNLSARTGIKGGPYELRTLGHAFDEMATALQARERQSEEQNRRISRLNRIQEVLSAINGAIIRIRDRDELLQEACRIAVDLGAFSFAWVGLLDPERDVLTLAAHAGSARDFIEAVRVSVRPDQPEGRGLMGTSIRNNAHAMSNSVQDDPRLAAWHEDFVRLGIRSAAAFPLCVDHAIVGALALYANEPGFFNDRELALLDQLAADTALGLEHIEKEHQLNYLAYWDPLTELPNQRLFEDRLEQSLRRAERAHTQVVVLTVDIVELGFINDTKGRAVGDRVLQTVARRLNTNVREEDSLSQLGRHAARLSNQEFGLVLDDLPDLAMASGVAGRIVAALTKPVPLDGGEIAFTARLGAAVATRDGTNAQELVHKALFALHNQSESEHGRLVFYSPEKDTAAQARYSLEAALRSAVDNGEFYLEYQPRIDARTGQLSGAEALLRWNRPGHGQVPPDQFIPTLERTGLIEPVGTWVARTAFAQRLAWHQIVPESFVVSINASACELRDSGYVSRMRSIIEEIGLPPDGMEIEITETGLVESGLVALDVLSALKSLGLRLSVDDFGTGYSSLSYLHQFPVDTLKIDKSFVRDIERDEAALSIVRSIMGLASALKLTVVAEGVETEQQLRLLLTEGCHEIQGYYFSRPLAPEALAALAGSESPFGIP